MLSKWEVIAVDLDYDLRWIHRLHSRALNCILKIRHVKPLLTSAIMYNSKSVDKEVPASAFA